MEIKKEGKEKREGITIHKEKLRTKYKKIIVYTIIFGIIFFIFAFPYIIPMKHSEKIISNGSILKVSAHIDSYSNSILDDNIVFIDIKLVKLPENASKIHLEFLYLDIRYFMVDSNKTLNLDLYEIKQNYSFIMNFKYDLSWKKVNMRFRLVFDIFFMNDSQISGDSNWMNFFILRPNPNWRGVCSGTVGVIFIFVTLYSIFKPKRKKIPLL